MRTKIIKWGNSLGLRIPKAFAGELGVTDGSPVELSLEDGRLVLRPAGLGPLCLADLLGEVTPENIHAEIDAGSPQGGEAW